MERVKLLGLQASGERGELWVGFHRAVTFSKWDLACSRDTLGNVDSRVSGKIAKVDDFWSIRTPTSIRLWMGKVWWAWDLVVLVSAIEEVAIGAIVEVRAEGAPVTLLLAET